MLVQKSSMLTVVSRELPTTVETYIPSDSDGDNIASAPINVFNDKR